MFHTLVIVSLLSLISPPVTGREHPPLDQISIVSTTIEKSVGMGTMAVASESSLDTGGTGCRDGTVQNVFNGDKTLLTLIFSDFTAVLEPPVAQRDKQRRFCAVNLAFDVPANWTFEVERLDWRGYVDIDRGVRGVLRSVYFWRGDREREDRATVRKVVEGPLHTDLTKTAEARRDKSVWLPCTRKQSVLHVNTVARLCWDGTCDGQGRDGPANAKGKVTPSGKGSITVDSLDAKFKQEMRIGWKKC